MISHINTKVSCDMRNCKNKAVYSLPLKGIGAALYLCADCADGLCDALNKLRIPKSPKNQIKKVIDAKKN